MELQANHVELKGKVSRLGSLKYTPSGVAVWEFTLAVPQTYFEKNSIGYFEVLLHGKYAEEQSSKLRVGQGISAEGNLWSRNYKNRQGLRLTEVKLVNAVVSPLQNKNLAQDLDR